MRVRLSLSDGKSNMTADGILALELSELDFNSLSVLGFGRVTSSAFCTLVSANAVCAVLRSLRGGKFVELALAGLPFTCFIVQSVQKGIDLVFLASTECGVFVE